MMENRRRVQWNEDSRWKSQSKRPPRGHPQGNCWQQTVPSWEKSFCKVVGSLDWETVLEKKKFSIYFDNVMNWDSSAGEDAFQIAKNRFWAQVHNTPCDVPLPDPDLYIDEIDWDCKIDPDMIMALDSKPAEPNPDEKHDPVIIFGDALIPNNAFSAPGWGEEENFKKASSSSLKNLEDPEHMWKNNEATEQWRLNGGVWSNGWGCDWNKEDHQNFTITGETGWGCDWNKDHQNFTITGETGWGCDWNKEDRQNFTITGETGWGSGWNNSGDGNYDWDNTNGWNCDHQKENYTNLIGGEAQYNSFSSYRRRGNRGRYLPKYKNVKFPSGDHHRNGQGQRKEEAFPWENSTSNGRPPSRECTMANNFGPDGWGKPVQAWSPKKQVM